jgi:hypothetical protein
MDVSKKPPEKASPPSQPMQPEPAPAPGAHSLVGAPAPAMPMSIPPPQRRGSPAGAAPSRSRSSATCARRSVSARSVRLGRATREARASTGSHHRASGNCCLPRAAASDAQGVPALQVTNRGKAWHTMGNPSLRADRWGAYPALRSTSRGLASVVDAREHPACNKRSYQ